MVTKRFNLALKEKIIVIKSLAFTQLLYASPMLYVPNQFIDKVEHGLRNFIWNGKPRKVRTLHNNIGFTGGGLKTCPFQNDDNKRRFNASYMQLINVASRRRSPLKLVKRIYSNSHAKILNSYAYISKIQCPSYSQVIKFCFEFYSVKPG